MAGVTVGDLEEGDLVELFARSFPAEPGALSVGDDAAAFSASGGTVLFTTDTMVEGVDFDRSYTGARDLGLKVLAINVSDVGAMGGTPTKAVATLCMPASTLVSWVEDLVAGLAAAASGWGVQIVGGDLSRAPSVVVGVALLGEVEEPITRSAARAGDAICVTGALGGSGAGLALLHEDPSATGPLVDRHLRPQPRHREGRALSSVGVTAMIDISDGLIIDLDRLMTASDRGCEIDQTLVPIDSALDDHPSRRELAMFGGEDFELLFTVAPSLFADAVSAASMWGVAVTRIGTVTDGERTFDGEKLEELRRNSWDHLRNP